MIFSISILQNPSSHVLSHQEHDLCWNFIGLPGVNSNAHFGVSFVQTYPGTRGKQSRHFSCALSQDVPHCALFGPLEGGGADEDNARGLASHLLLIGARCACFHDC